MFIFVSILYEELSESSANLLEELLANLLEELHIEVFISYMKEKITIFHMLFIKTNLIINTNKAQR